MPSVKEKQRMEQDYFLGEIYKNTKMGADAIIHLLPHVKEDALRSLMTQQLDGYEKYAARAAKEIEACGGTPKEENIFTRATARVAMGFQTMMDSTTGHIAELMIEGSNMGITDMIKLLNAYAGSGKAENAVRLAREVVAFEEHNLTLLKHFL